MLSCNFFILLETKAEIQHQSIGRHLSSLACQPDPCGLECPASKWRSLTTFLKQSVTPALFYRLLSLVTVYPLRLSFSPDRSCIIPVQYNLLSDLRHKTARDFALQLVTKCPVQVSPTTLYSGCPGLCQPVPGVSVEPNLFFGRFLEMLIRRSL